ncbi:MAG TPA: DUF2505 family protein [Acidimicrobiales bacterium]
MDFRAENLLHADLDAVLAAYADPDLAGQLGALTPLSAGELVDHSREGDVVHLRVRYAYQGELPAGATRLVDPSLLTWVLATDLDLQRRRSFLVLQPDHYADRLRARAVERFEPAPLGGTSRITEGRLAVQMFLVAKAVERALVSGLEEWLANEAVAVDTWIAGRSTPTG